MASSNGTTVSKDAGAGHVVAFADAPDQTRHVMLVTRTRAPFNGQPALPGGDRAPGETSRAAVVRAVQESTGIGLPAAVLRYLGTWDVPRSDEDGTDSTDVFTVLLPDMPELRSGDGSSAAWTPLAAVRTMLLAHNHNDIVDTASAD